MSITAIFESLRKQREATNRRVYFYCDANDVVAEAMIFCLIGEAKKHIDLGQGKHVYMHKANIPNSQDHLHFYMNRTKLFALNRDGTAHDQSHGKVMANWTVDAIKAYYPTFQFPKSKLIEHLLSEGQGAAVEESAKGRPVIPAAIIQRSEVEVR